MSITVALKVDVDTERGTREGVPALAALLTEFHAPAAFLFSLGPDNTGKAIRRVLRPGFFQKVSRTSVVQVYGIRTLLNGTLLPVPHIGSRHAGVMRSVRDAGFECGIHCHDHFQWLADCGAILEQGLHAAGVICAPASIRPALRWPGISQAASPLEVLASALASADQPVPCPA